MAQWREDQPIVDPKTGKPTRAFLILLDELLVRRQLWVDAEPHPDPELDDVWIGAELKHWNGSEWV